jgi:hypothetical protein
MPRRHRVLAAGGGLIAIALAGCGAGTGGQVGAGPGLSKQPARAQASRALPAGWGTLRLASGASLPYPSSWRRVSGDPGSASAALFNADGTMRAYLNATPADGHETLPGWARFRVRHNAAEGDRNVRLITARPAVGLAAGRASCVVDDYRTSRSRYRELACILAPSSGGRATVLVAAARPNAWSREHPVFDFAINHVTS